MPRQTKKKLTPAERLARLLRAAHLEAYLETNKDHASPDWEECKRLGWGNAWLRVARALLKRGVALPLVAGEDEVDWTGEKDAKAT